MYYPSSENKGADQLRGYREADLRQALFSPMQIVGFPMRRLKCKHIRRSPRSPTISKFLKDRTKNRRPKKLYDERGKYNVGISIGTPLPPTGPGNVFLLLQNTMLIGC